MTRPGSLALRPAAARTVTTQAKKSSVAKKKSKMDNVEMHHQSPLKTSIDSVSELKLILYLFGSS